MKLSQVIVQIYKLSHPAVGTKLRNLKVKHDRLHIALLVNQNKLSHWNPHEEGQRFHGVTFSSCSWGYTPW